MSNLDQPLTAQERYLYGINLRLDALLDMFSSFLEVYAKQNGLATTDNVVNDVIPESTPTPIESKVIRKSKKK